MDIGRINFGYQPYRFDGPLKPPPINPSGVAVCPAKPALESASVPSAPQSSSNLHGKELEELCRLMHEQNRILLGLSSQLSLLMQTMAEDQGNEDGGFTSLDQT